MRAFPQKKRDKFSLSITQAIANEPITQKHKDTHKKSIPVGSKANTGTKGFAAIVNINPEKPDVPLNKNDAFQKVQKRRVQEKR